MRLLHIWLLNSKSLGIYSDVVNLNRTEQIAWQDYDRVVIGASIRYGHFHPALDRFVKKHTAEARSTAWRVLLGQPGCP